MLQKILPLLIFFVLVSSVPAWAIYDPLSVPNNKFGMHILETSEVSKAREFANSSGGDWGYVTIPIRANDRDLPKWTKFMSDCRDLHLIPILRIASFPVDDHWMAPNEWDIIDFVNFMDELPWPTQNRYIIIYNEPNHKNEWGGFVYPEEYARVLFRAADIFHKRNPDYFIISAGFDSSAPDGADSMNEYEYMQAMDKEVSGIFSQVDGISSHAYGNPGFQAVPNVYSPVNIANYRFEEKFLATMGVDKPKMFITEGGWMNPPISFYQEAFDRVWVDPNIVAITPFVLDGGVGPFAPFSFVDNQGQFKPFAKAIMSIQKSAGKPELTPVILPNSGPTGPLSAGPTLNYKDLFDQLRFLAKKVFNITL